MSPRQDQALRLTAIATLMSIDSQHFEPCARVQSILRWGSTSTRRQYG
jgi:hypothetical protein